MPQTETVPLQDTPSLTEAAVSRRALLTAGAGDIRLCDIEGTGQLKSVILRNCGKPDPAASCWRAGRRLSASSDPALLGPVGA